VDLKGRVSVPGGRKWFCNATLAATGATRDAHARPPSSPPTAPLIDERGHEARAANNGTPAANSDLAAAGCLKGQRMSD
jgi:hypothetical protein